MFQPTEIFDRFLETFDRTSIVMFRSFLERNAHASKWLISADYCLHDTSRPNDCMCFSITPYDTDFDELKTSVQSVMGRDLKKTRTVSDDAAAFLRDGRFFHVAILLPKTRNVFANGPGSDPLAVAREVASITLTQVKERERGTEAVRRFRKLLIESRANGFNKELFGDMILLALFFSFISLLIVRERQAKMVGWFSDRDSMTEWCDRILWNMVHENLLGLAELRQITITNTEFPIAIPELDTGKMWFDHLVLRIADYIAGTLAVWNIKSNVVSTDSKSDKFIKIIEDVIADSENLVVLGLDIGNEGLQWKRIRVDKGPPEEQRT